MDKLTELEKESRELLSAIKSKADKENLEMPLPALDIMEDDSKLLRRRIPSWVAVAAMLAGIVIMIVTVARGHVVINRGRYSIPSGKRFTTIFVNVGMILFLIGCFAEVIINTFC